MYWVRIMPSDTNYPHTRREILSYRYSYCKGISGLSVTIYRVLTTENNPFGKIHYKDSINVPTLNTIEVPFKLGQATWTLLRIGIGIHAFSYFFCRFENYHLIFHRGNLVNARIWSLNMLQRNSAYNNELRQIYGASNPFHPTIADHMYGLSWNPSYPTQAYMNRIAEVFRLCSGPTLSFWATVRTWGQK